MVGPIAALCFFMGYFVFLCCFVVMLALFFYAIPCFVSLYASLLLALFSGSFSVWPGLPFCEVCLASLGAQEGLDPDQV